MPELIVILTTVQQMAEAERLAEGLVSNRLAACVQILPQITSVYAWEERTVRDSEHLLLVKTTVDRFEEADKYIRDNHSYDVPEVVGIAAERFSEAYGDWLAGWVSIR
ncbi:MAG: divalent-cation tolerance protein CutA [Pyrinomonadaceae bacterium]